VGSGPVTTLGYSHPECKIYLFLVDVLVEDYAKLLERYGIPSPFLPIKGEA